MTVLVVILSVFLLLAVILFLPISVKICFFDDFFFKVYFGGIKVYEPTKKKKKSNVDNKYANTKTEKERKNNPIRQEFEERGVLAGIQYFGAVLKELLTSLMWFVKKLRFKMFLFDITVATDNAYDTAIEYGLVCTAVYPVLSLLIGNADVKVKKINISTDFNVTTYDFKTDIQVSTRLIYAVVAALSFIRKYKKITDDYNNKKGSPSDE